MILLQSRLRRIGIVVISLLVLIPIIIYAVAYAIYPIKNDTFVETYAEEYGLDPSFVYAVIHTESKFDPDAVSPAGAKGLMQITDDTFRWAQQRCGENLTDSDVLFQPATNIRYGCFILSFLSQEFEDTETVLAAYNAGRGRVQKWLSDPAYSSDGKTLSNIPYEETATYVRRVLTAQKRYQQLYNIT